MPASEKVTEQSAPTVIATPVAARVGKVKPSTREQNSIDTTPPPPIGRVRVTPKPEPTKPDRPSGRRSHVVAKGDTVYNIAKRYNLTAAEVMKANSMRDDARIGLGSVLTIPVRK